MVIETARGTGWSSRSLQRHCSAVYGYGYGYGPAQLRRILRFRRAVRLLQSGLTPAVVAAQAGYADQSHLHRDVRALAAVSLPQLGSAANRSTEVPAGRRRRRPTSMHPGHHLLGVSLELIRSRQIQSAGTKFRGFLGFSEGW